MASIPAARTLSPFTRRRLLVTGALGLAAAATAGSVAPAAAAPRGAETGTREWTEEVLTRPENREGFLPEAVDDWQEENAKFLIAGIMGQGLGEEGAVIAPSTASGEA